MLELTQLGLDGIKNLLSTENWGFLNLGHYLIITRDHNFILFFDVLAELNVVKSNPRKSMNPLKAPFTLVHGQKLIFTHLYNPTIFAIKKSSEEHIDVQKWIIDGSFKIHGQNIQFWQKVEFKCHGFIDQLDPNWEFFEIFDWFGLSFFD